MPPTPRAPNNLIAEWFGHRVYPSVASSRLALADQQAHRCPFLTVATGSPRECVKAPKSRGVCTVSSTSNGSRQDWLVRPHRAQHGALIEDCARRLFGALPGRPVVIRPAPALTGSEVRAEIVAALQRGTAAFIYLQANFGGEVSLSATNQSPELSFDVTVVELVLSGSTPSVGRYAILEIQTMDFHGTYSKAVKDLDDALRLHSTSFHPMLRKNVGWLSKGMEGPNIANVFKQTLYQMLLKFRLAGHGACAGAALAIPAAVWDSWQRHLGAPELAPAPDGTYRLAHVPSPTEPRAWLYIFDIDAKSKTSPNPIVLSKIVGTDVDAVAHYAFKAAPDAILAEGGSGSLVLDTIRLRLAEWWPELGPPKQRTTRLSKA